MIRIYIGKSAAGKDYFYRKDIKENGFKPVVSYTTRPMRENEVNGRDYNFIGIFKFHILRGRRNIQNRTGQFRIFTEGEHEVYIRIGARFKAGELRYGGSTIHLRGTLYKLKRRIIASLGHILKVNGAAVMRSSGKAVTV